MTRDELCIKRDEALGAFGLSEKALSCTPYGNGHINDTFLAVCKCGKRYILQRINHHIFTKPQEIMENICAVTSFIRKKAIADGGDAERCTLSVVKTRSGESFYEDSIGSFWRLYDFTEGTVAKERVSNLKEFCDCAFAFGNFQAQLAEFDASSLSRTFRLRNAKIRVFRKSSMRFSRSPVLTVSPLSNSYLMKSARPRLKLLNVSRTVNFMMPPCMSNSV